MTLIVARMADHELGGWESESAVRQNANVAPTQLNEQAERVAPFLGGTFSAHGEKAKG